MMRFASAATPDGETEAAIDRVVAGVREGLAGERADALFVFFGPAHAPAAPTIRDRLRAAFPGAKLLGCTAGGVIGGGREFESPRGLSLSAARLPGAEVVEFHVEAGGLPSPDAGPSAWQRLVGVLPAAGPSFVIAVDPYSFPAQALVAGLDFAFPEATKVGGLASGASGPGDQTLLLGDRVLRTGAVGFALTGDVAIVPAVAQGCRPIGPVLTVTRCDENLLHELDGHPALEVAHRVLREADERDRELARAAALFVGLETDPFGSSEGHWLVRNILGRERDGGGLYVGERLRPGRRLRFHVRDRVSSSEDLDRTLLSAHDGPGNGCKGALLFSCLGRGMHLYGVPDHDTRAFHARFPGAPVGGFFCSGEIGPVGEQTHLHGFTSSFGLLRPRRT